MHTKPELHLAQDIDPSQVEGITKNVIIYTDGSYNQKTSDFGSGFVIDFMDNEGTKVQKRFINSDSGTDIPHGMRNVTGEIAAVVLALTEIQNLINKGANIDYIVLVHDYTGIEGWGKVNRPWKANKPYTQYYSNYIKMFRQNNPCTVLDFLWVKGHGDIEGNQIADRIAGEASGVMSPSLQMIKLGVIPPIEPKSNLS